MEYFEKFGITTVLDPNHISKYEISHKLEMLFLAISHYDFFRVA